MADPTTSAAADSSAWKPLRQPEFRAVWGGVLAMHLATWMNQVGGATLMTGLTPSPVMAAFVQTAASLPAVFLGLPAGALADLVDRRKLMFLIQLWMLFCTALATVVVVTGALNPFLLLVLTAMLGTGFALQTPASQAVFGEVVPREDIPAALALGGMSYNLSRVVGPALAGIVIGLAGGVALYLALAACSAAVLVSLTRWQRRGQRSLVPPERLWSALRSGVRYVRHAPDCHVPLLHTLLFMSCGSAAWALLPVIARDVYALGAQGYGLLLGCFGVGGLCGVFLMPRVRRRVGLDVLVATAAAVFALVTGVLALGAPLPVTLLALVIGGIAWMIGATLIYAALQDALPDWVRGRGLSFFNLIYFFAMAGGAALWGLLTTPLGTRGALAAAAVAMLAAAVWLKRQPLRFSPDAQANAAEVRLDGDAPQGLPPALAPDEGPLVIEISYRVRPDAEAEFLRAAHAVGRSCRRNGAVLWRLYRVLEEPQVYMERCMVDTSLDRERLLDRTTPADAHLRRQLLACLEPGHPPKIRHQLIEPANSED